MNSIRKHVVVSCLDCENPIELSFRPVVGQVIDCPHCRAELEIISDNPLELDFYYEGDWDSDEEWEPSDDEDEPQTNGAATQEHNN
jgi:hypothetical protein